MKKSITVNFEEEKLEALQRYAEQKGVSIEEELVQTMESLYQKVVPAAVRNYLCMKADGRKPKKNARDDSASAVGD